MGRRPGYEIDGVLRAAAALFKARGFNQVSVESIIAATGLNRFALYEKLGGKKGLFYETLDFYHQVMVKEELLGPLYRGGASVQSVVSMLRMLQAMNSNPELRPGCLIVNANMELNGSDERVATACQLVSGSFREAVGHALKYAEDSGELAGRRPALEAAEYVALMIQAFFALGYLSRESAGKLIAYLIEEVEGWQYARAVEGATPARAWA